MFPIVLIILIGVQCSTAQQDSGYEDAELSSSGNSGSESESKELEPICVPETGDERETLCKNATVDFFDIERTRYFPQTKKCYVAGQTGPCPNNLVFHSTSEPPDNTVYGDCDCDSTRNDRTLIYHPSTQTCYFIFEHAYCPEGQWLTLDPANGQPKCESNPCFASAVKKKGGATRRSIDNQDLVFVDGKCVKLGSVCGEIDGVEHFIGFSNGKLLPFCKPKILRPADDTITAIKQTYGITNIKKPYAITAIKQSCAPGTFLSISGYCQASWVW